MAGKARMPNLASPPAHLAELALPSETLLPGATLYRLHPTERGPKHFGRAALGRFDSPIASFGTLYAGLSPNVAFAETLIRGKGSLIASSELALRSLCVFRVLNRLRLVKLCGPALTKLHASADISSGPIAVSQQWAQALHDHPDSVDGVVYRAKYDNDELAIALFERSHASIDEGTSKPLLDDNSLLASILDHYELALY
jgi:hypothetical protein